MSEVRIAELFAGVGGFRLGLEGYADPRYPDFYMKPAGPFRTIWANQWEPPGTKARQFAARCYMDRFGEDSVVNEDINKVLEQAEASEIEIPDVDMVEAMRSDRLAYLKEPATAAPWLIRLMVITAVVIVIPRLFLAFLARHRI